MSMKYNAKMWKGFCNYEMDFAMKGWAARPRLWSLTNMTLATWHCHDDMTKPDNMTGSGCLQFSVCGQGRRGTGGTPPCWRRWRRTRGWRWRLPSSRRSWTGSWLAGYPYNTHLPYSHTASAYIKFPPHHQNQKTESPDQSNLLCTL